MKIERPRLGGGCPSYVVVTDFFRVPGFKTGIAGRKKIFVFTIDNLGPNLLTTP